MATTPATSSGLVDAHHHLWDVRRRDHPWMDGPWADPLRGAFGLDRLTAEIAGHGVEETVVVQAVSDLDETRELLATAAASDLVAGVVGWVDLTAPDVADTLHEMRDGPGGEFLVGVRHQVEDEPDRHWLTRDDVRSGLRAVGEAGLTYDLLVTPPQLPAATETVARLPEVRFVLDHLAKPVVGELDPWRRRLTDLAAHPNVTAKLSGLTTQADWSSWTPGDLAPWIGHALATFGPDRLMYGSDWPVCTLAATYAQALEAVEVALTALSPDERDRIHETTARSVYRLPRRAGKDATR